MSSHKIIGINEASATSPTFLDVTDGSFDPQTEIDAEGQSGSVLQGVAGISQHRPMAQITTRSVAAAIDLFSLSGYEIDTDSLELYSVLRDSGGGLQSTGTLISFDSGLAVPTSLTASQGDLATIEYSIYGGGSGSKPYSITTSSDVPSVTSAADTLWTVGAATINSTDIGPVQTISLDFSFDVQYAQGDGNIWPEAVFIDQVSITGTIETLDPEAVSTVDEGDTNAVTMTLNQKEGSGINDTGSKSISFDSSIVTVSQLQGSERDNATTSLNITATSSDYSTFPVSIT